MITPGFVAITIFTAFRAYAIPLLGRESISDKVCTEPRQAICRKAPEPSSPIEKQLNNLAGEMAAQDLGIEAKNWNEFSQKTKLTSSARQAYLIRLEQILQKEIGDLKATLIDIKQSLLNAVKENEELSVADKTRMENDLISVNFISTSDFLKQYGVSVLERQCASGPSAMLVNLGSERKSIFVCPGVWIRALESRRRGDSSNLRVREYLYFALSHEVAERIAFERYPQSYKKLQARLSVNHKHLRPEQIDEITADYWAVRALANVIDREHTKKRSVNALVDAYVIRSYLENSCSKRNSEKDEDRLTLIFGNADIRDALQCDD